MSTDWEIDAMKAEDEMLALSELHAEQVTNLHSRIRYLEKREHHLIGILNRIWNLTPGRQRIYQLDTIADNLEITAGLEEESSGRVTEFVQTCYAESLDLRRMSYDLSDLRDVVRGDAREMSRTDPRHWRGERP